MREGGYPLVKFWVRIWMTKLDTTSEVSPVVRDYVRGYRLSSVLIVIWINFVVSYAIGSEWSNQKLRPGFHRQFEAMCGVTDSPLVRLPSKSFYVASSEVGFVCGQIGNCVWGFTGCSRLCPRLSIVLWFDCHPNHFKDQFCMCQMVVWGRWDTPESQGVRCVVNSGVTPRKNKAQ
jgi:hypothetical protein